MNARVLTAKQQKKSLSSMKKKKKVQKSILTLPDDMKIRIPKVNIETISPISEILKSLLLGARLPVLDIRRKEGDKSETETSITTDVSENRKKRSQFLLGVNCVSKGIRNESAACILFASDIKPRLLINHMIVLCSLKNIPYIFVPGLRILTKDTLGFSCIVLGLKKNFTEFTLLINLVKSAVGGLKNDCDKELFEECQVTETFYDDKLENSTNENEKEKKLAFTYLYRDFNKRKIYIPDISQKEVVNNEDSSFIPLTKFCESEIRTLGMSKEFQEPYNSCVKDNHNKSLLRKKYKSKNITRRYGTNCKVNVKRPITYSEAKVVKMESNCDRGKKKFNKLKKKIVVNKD